LRFNIKTSDVLIKGYICVAWKGGGVAMVIYESITITILF
jgi:hypothetical protein